MEDTRLQRGIVVAAVLFVLASLSACRTGTGQPTPPVSVATARPEAAAATPEVGEATPTLRPAVPGQPPEGPTQPAPGSVIIVDNADPGFAIEAGDWGTCHAGDCDGVCYGADFRFAEPTCSACRARFSFQIASAGEYDVWAWWPYGEDRATDTPFTIMYSGGPFKVNVDQRNAGDAWYWLAAVTFNAGESASIMVEGTATGYANADAIALTPAGSGAPGEVVPRSTPSAGEAPVIQYFTFEAASNPGCFYLHWDVSQATAVLLNDETVDNPGSTEVCPEGTAVYTLKAENTAGNVQQTLTVAVQATPATPAATPSSPSRPTAAATVVSPAAGFRRIIFLHHSTGANLIEQGGVRARFTALGYEFDDHGYNGDGLVLADGAPTGRNFDVPDDNTNPDGYAAIFAQPLHDPPDNTFSHLMQYDVIVFKSCFPVSIIESDEQLAEYKSYYLSIRQRMDQNPNKIFVVVTQPPEIPADTNPQAAARARAFTNWLASDEYLNGHRNVFTFNFFNLLANPSTNMLRAEYQTDPSDAHPNERANQTIAPLFVAFVDQAIKTYAAR